MAHITSRKHAVAAAPQLKNAALGLMIAALPAAALAQNTAPATPATAPKAAEQQLAPVTVTGKQESEIKVEQMSSPKFTEPLVNTPQTITIIPKEVLQQQGASTLTEALRNTPGITMQLGENGNTSAGDTFFMRGFSATSSIFVDGVRDLGGITRDVFNTEQIEVVKGPSGADVGRGATSGYINLSSKVPYAEDFSSGSLSYNSGGLARITADYNERLGDSGNAIRLNAMGQNGGVAGRDDVKKEGWGFAPALALGLGTSTRAYAYAQIIRHNNRRPDGGVPTIGWDGYYRGTNAGVQTPGEVALNNAAKVDASNYYGLDSDYENQSADMLTVRLEHDLMPGTTIRNLSRYGKSSIERVLTGVGNVNTPTGAAINNPSSWTVAMSRQGLFQENEILTNQTNVTSDFATGALKHSMSGGVEFIYEEQFTPTYGGFGAAAAGNNLYNPHPGYPVLTTPINVGPTGTSTRGETTTAAIYLFDTVEITKQWLMNLGGRLEHYSTDYMSTTTTPATSLNANGNLFSWKTGAVFKPVENGSIYAGYSTSERPPGNENFSLSNSAGNTNNAALDPQEATNIELGTKWEFFNNALLFNAALYRSENKNEPVLIDSASNTYAQYGKRRVEGIELSAVGNITSNWAVTAGLATMKTKVLEAAPGTAGAIIQWSPELTANLWTTYKLPFNLTVGGGVRYVDMVKRSTTANTTQFANTPEMPSYWVADAMVNYAVNKNFDLQLNIYNLFDKEYMASLNNAGSRYTPGTPRSAQLTANIRF
ncbi:catecholate siderophore receptor Fiu [Uliginosibacterium sp. H1]|uniref:catecholate siderophore receptor Fiu n=1 Tax=Uliginosibacterium sp. H1 TaxID=3114757 RepID=UPI002E17B07A|nr:catecholate siderophore receptor Fiu [Uliginosibacterium sp. H1]